MNVLQEVRRTLQLNGYRVVAARDAVDQIQFEDDSLMGFVWEAPTAAAIVTNWRQKQDDFLRRNSNKLRSSEFKSWNIYGVFLTGESASGVESAELKEVEEDFRATRKIARGGIETNSQLLNALYPFVPIQHLVPFDAENPSERLKEKLDKLPRNAVQVLFDQTADEQEIWAKFMDSYENQ
jgi:hypothetical protein